MVETVEFSITRASQLTIPNKDWTHYRSGLKIRCSSGSLGVSIAVISQGKSIDTTMITSSNVRFLSKEPIVGLKIFDGEKLRKRLQITFSSEGEFNMFTNKVSLWIGVPVNLKYDTSDLQVANSQAENTCEFFSQPRQLSSSQVVPEQVLDPPKQFFGSQHESQTMDSSFALSQNFSEEKTAQIAYSQENTSQQAYARNFSQPPSAPVNSYSSYGNHYLDTQGQVSANSTINASANIRILDALHKLANVVNNDLARPPHQLDTSMNSQSTSLCNEASKDNILLYPQATASNTFCNQAAFDGDTTINFPNSCNHSKTVVSGSDMTQILGEIPFTPSRKRTKLHVQKRRHNKDEFLESTLSRLLQKKHEGYMELSDAELSLKVCRTLKRKSFLTFLKRVEGLLDEQ